MLVQQTDFDHRSARYTLPLTTHKKILQPPLIKHAINSIDTYSYPAVFSYAPQISLKSRKLASKLNTTFQERQQLHLVRRDKYFESELEINTIQSRTNSLDRAIRSDKDKTLISKVIPFSRSLSNLKKQTNKLKTTPITPTEDSLIPVKKERPKSLIVSTSRDAKQTQERPARTDRLTVLKTRANRAVNNKNIFKVKGPYKIMRRELRKRGWIEQDYESKYAKETTKITPNVSKNETETDSNTSDYDSSSDCPSDEEEYCTLTRLVRNALPNFIITLKSADIESKFLTKSQFANHFRKTGCFTTKSGLTQMIQELTWFSDINPIQFFPRCFLLSSAEDQPIFIQDYLKTAAISLLKHLKRVVENGNFKTNENTASKIPVSTVKFALNICNEILKAKQHKDLDEATFVTSFDENNPSWKLLLESSILLKTEQITWQKECKDLFKEISDLLSSLHKLMPQFDLDGSCNIWIVKPGAMSRGRGIKCLSKLDSILELVSARVLLKEGKYVVQKYIENPLLIERTKFDIRQWFLVTDWSPLTVWIYRECYVRFSGQPFSLDNFHESIHLCNNSIQKNYSISKNRSNKLPTDNMCDLEELTQYLIEITGSDLWGESLLDKAKKILFSVMLSSSPNVEPHKGSFELFGADFMIGEDLQLYLLEINSSPTMARNTVVTKRLCKQVQEDLIRFLIDEQKSKQKAESCNWILAGKGPKLNLQTPPYGVCQDMAILGKRIRPIHFS